jgi:hypothetical protein
MVIHDFDRRQLNPLPLYIEVTLPKLKARIAHMKNRPLVQAFPSLENHQLK